MTSAQLATHLPDDPLLAEVLGELFALKAKTYSRLSGLDSLTVETASSSKVHPELDAYLKVAREITSTLNEAGLTPKARSKKGDGDGSKEALESVKKFLVNRPPSKPGTE